MVELKKVLVNTFNRNNKNPLYQRYKVELMSQDSLVNTLGIPSDRSRLRVMQVIRRELRAGPTVTHAVVRALDGEEHIIYAADGRIVSLLKALKL